MLLEWFVSWEFWKRVELVMLGHGFEAQNEEVKGLTIMSS